MENVNIELDMREALALESKVDMSTVYYDATSELVVEMACGHEDCAINIWSEEHGAAEWGLIPPVQAAINTDGTKNTTLKITGLHSKGGRIVSIDSWEMVDPHTNLPAELVTWLNELEDVEAPEYVESNMIKELNEMTVEKLEQQPTWKDAVKGVVEAVLEVFAAVIISVGFATFGTFVSVIVMKHIVEFGFTSPADYLLVGTTVVLLWFLNKAWSLAMNQLMGND